VALSYVFSFGFGNGIGLDVGCMMLDAFGKPISVAWFNRKVRKEKQGAQGLFKFGKP